MCNAYFWMAIIQLVRVIDRRLYNIMPGCYGTTRSLLKLLYWFCMKFLFTLPIFLFRYLKFVIWNLRFLSSRSLVVLNQGRLTSWRLPIYHLCVLLGLILIVDFFTVWRISFSRRQRRNRLFLLSNRYDLLDTFLYIVNLFNNIGAYAIHFKYNYN